MENPLLLDFLIKSGFLALIASVFVAHFKLKSLLNYGKTLKFGKSPILTHLVYVPKSWFVYFYYWCAALLFASISFIGLYSKHPEHVTYHYYQKFLPTSQYCPHTSFLISSLIFIHSLRRIYECHFITKFNPAAKIHVSHFIAGIFFYTAINLINLPNFKNCTLVSVTSKNLLQTNSSGFATLLLVLLNLFSQIFQNSHHAILANTKKYKHPTQLHFKYISNPHYLYEILIYLSYFLIVLAHDRIIDYNWLLVVLWVLINLSVSGYNSYKYYLLEMRNSTKNDPTDVNTNFLAKYVIIPFVF